MGNVVFGNRYSLRSVFQGAAWLSSCLLYTSKVVDVQGHTLPGVTVVIKGTNLGVATDMDGRFSIQVPRGKAVVLVCTFVGMRKKEVNYVEGKELTIVMEEEAAEMDEVIVTGYFQKSKESFTGSEVTINTEELKKVGALNMIQADVYKRQIIWSIRRRANRRRYFRPVLIKLPIMRKSLI